MNNSNLIVYLPEFSQCPVISSGLSDERLENRVRLMRDDGASILFQGTLEQLKDKLGAPANVREAMDQAGEVR